MLPCPQLDERQRAHLVLQGVMAVVEEVRKQAPSAQVVVFGLLPLQPRDQRWMQPAAPPPPPPGLAALHCAAAPAHHVLLPLPRRRQAPTLAAGGCRFAADPPLPLR